jgi:DNA-3-methyladenine glycosylase II
MTAAAVADPTAREFLLNADPVLARVIDAHPDFQPRAWIDELPGLDAFGTLIFQIAGQQLSVRATRSILSRLEQSFRGHLPSPAQLLSANPHVLRASGLSARKGATLRALAERFVDGRLSDEAFARMTDDEIETALTDRATLDSVTPSNDSTASTTFPASRRWTSLPSLGDRTEAWR